MFIEFEAGSTRSSLIEHNAKLAARVSVPPMPRVPRLPKTWFTILVASGRPLGRFSRELDQALPGAHTKMLYDTLRRKEAAVLIQLRTGMSRLNGYLHGIKVTDSDLCQCGTARKTVKHFLFRCPRWDNLRQDLLSQTQDKRGNLSFYLGGKTCQDPATWVPNMKAIHATIRCVLRTKRLEDTRDIIYPA